MPMLGVGTGCRHFVAAITTTGSKSLLLRKPRLPQASKKRKANEGNAAEIPAKRLFVANSGDK